MTALKVRKEQKQLIFNKSNANFVLMIAGRFISELGTSIFVFSLSLYVLNSTKSAALYSAVLSFSILPNILTNIIGGVIVDKYKKKKLIVGSDLVSGIIVFLFLFFFKIYHSGLFIIIVFNMLLTAVQGLFSLTMTSSIANVVDEKQVPKLNSVFTAFGSANNISGPFLGAVIYQHFDMSVIFTINGMSFIISGILEMFIVFHQPNPGETNRRKNNIISDYLEVISYLKATVKIRILLIINSFLILVFAPLGAIIVPYVSYHVIHVSELQLAVIQGSLAMGAIIASFLMTMIPSIQYFFKKLFLFIHMQTAGIFLLCLPALFTYTGNTKWAVTITFSLCLIFLGMIAVIRSIPISVFFQTNIKESIRGRFFGFQNTLSILFSFIGMWLYGVILDLISWIYLVLASGISSVIIIGVIQFRDKQKRAQTVLNQAK